MISTTTSTKWNIPGPNPLPIFGNRASVIKLVKDSIGYTDQLFKTYGNVVSLSAGGGTNIYSPLLNCPGTVFTYGPESMRQAISQLDVYSKYPLSGTLYRLRVTSQLTQLENYELPTGTEVFVSIYKTHHLPEIYLQPEQFNPQRWENFEPTIFEYNPFSGGSRLCIGAGFAMMEIKIILAMLLQKYRLEFSSPYPIDRSSGIPVIYPKYGMQMLVCHQDRQFTQGVGGVQGNVRQMVELPT